MVGGKRWLGVCAGAFVVGVTPLTPRPMWVSYIHVHIDCIPTSICFTPQSLLYSEPPMLA